MERAPASPGEQQAQVEAGQDHHHPSHNRPSDDDEPLRAPGNGPAPTPIRQRRLSGIRHAVRGTCSASDSSHDDPRRSTACQRKFAILFRLKQPSWYDASTRAGGRRVQPSRGGGPQHAIPTTQYHDPTTPRHATTPATSCHDGTGSSGTTTNDPTAGSPTSRSS